MSSTSSRDVATWSTSQSRPKIHSEVRAAIRIPDAVSHGDPNAFAQATALNRVSSIGLASNRSG